VPFALWISASIGGAAVHAAAITIDKPELRFTLVLRDGGPPIVTPPQIVFVEPTTPTERTPFSVEVSDPWLRVVSHTGRAPGRVSIEIVPEAIQGSAGSRLGTVTVRGNTSASLATVNVSLNVLRGASNAPFGSLDAPGAATVLGTGGVMFAGWALDDVAITDVEVCAVGKLAAPNDDPCGLEGSTTRLGRANFMYGGRPDVMKLFAVPRHERASWSFAVMRDALTRLGPGPFEVYAIARDGDGHAASIGHRTVTIAPVVTPLPYPTIALTLLAACFGFAQLWLWERVRRIDGRSGAPSQRPPLHWSEPTTLAIIIAAFAGMQASAMQTGFEYDELFTSSQFVIGHSLWDVPTLVFGLNNHVALSLAAGVSTRIFGHAEWALRLPSVGLGALTLVATWWLARRIANRWVAGLSAALLSLSPFFFSYSHLARGYVGVALMGVLSSAAFLSLLREPSRRMAGTHAVASILAVYFNLYGTWILIIQYLLLVAVALGLLDGKERSARGLRLLLASFSVTGAALVVLHFPIVKDILAVLELRGRAPVIPAFPLELYSTMAPSNWPAVSLAAASLVLLGLSRQRRLVAIYMAATLAVPLLVMWLVARPLDLGTRFFVYWTPFFAYLLASGLVALAELARRQRSPVRFATIAALAGAIIACGTLVAGWIQRDREPPGQGYEAVGRATIRESGWQSYAIGGDAVMFDYYLPRPMIVLRTVEDLDRALREDPRLQVAYHDMTWNTETDRKLADVLTARCEVSDAPPVRMFRCE
jgi:hypothetical protein